MTLAPHASDRQIRQERSTMKKRKTKQVMTELKDPAWVKDDAPNRSTPYTEEELDLLVEGTMKSIQDTVAWKKLVMQVGIEEAQRVLRSRLIMNDENTEKITRH